MGVALLTTKFQLLQTVLVEQLTFDFDLLVRFLRSHQTLKKARFLNCGFRSSGVMAGSEYARNVQMKLVELTGVDVSVEAWYYRPLLHDADHVNGENDEIVDEEDASEHDADVDDANEEG